VPDPASSDRALVKRLLRGEEAAFEEFFRGYFPRLYRFALIRLGYDEDAAEEIVQATLCHAITVLGTYRGEAALFTWLCTLCRREMGAHLRRQAREPLAVGSLEDSPEARAALESLAAALESTPEDDIRRKEIAEAVQGLLDFLPAGYGDALEWKYALGLPVKEIADRLGLSPKAAESLLTRARQAFRREFVALTGERLRPGPAKP
jgi:RNA polymerase sigma-70 factor (ECF subfamily)